jgi:hypothetical protein
VFGKKYTFSTFSDYKYFVTTFVEAPNGDYKVKLGVPREVERTFVAHQLKAKRLFGCDSFMLGVAYFTVTFLAHIFPHLTHSQTPRQRVI